ncbi:uncharacterized protein [Ptychodera flava]
MSGELKKGYLRRYGGFLFKSWKKRYLVAYQDGQLAWYESPGGSRENLLNLKQEVSMLRIGGQCASDAPKLPSHRDRIDHMFAMTAVGGKTYFFLAADQTELISWLQAFHQARGLPPPGQAPEGQGQGQPGGPGMPQPQQPAAPPPGFQPGVTQGQPPPYSGPQYGARQPGPQYGASQPYPQQQAGRAYPVQQGGPVRHRPQQQTVIVQDRGGRDDGLATGMLLGYGMGMGYGYGGWGWGWGHGPGLGYGWGHHHHGFHDHHHEHHHEHYHEHNHDGAMEQYDAQQDYGGQDYGGADYGGGDFGELTTEGMILVAETSGEILEGMTLEGVTLGETFNELYAHCSLDHLFVKHIYKKEVYCR